MKWIFAVFFFVGFFLDEQACADNFRCPNGNIVSTGDSILTVAAKCDTPAGTFKRAEPMVIEVSRGDSKTGTKIIYIEVEEWGMFPGPHMNIERMWAVRNRIKHHLSRAEVDGVVVTHGTDALEESAYIVARSLLPDKPVVFTGAMRPASDIGWDGPSNLLDAVRVAASPLSRGKGTLVCMSERVHSALQVLHPVFPLQIKRADDVL